MFKTIDPQDIHNISVLPSFVSPNNLHTNTLVLHGKGIPFKSVKDDIDGKPRDKNHPDIGANELIVKHDLGIDSAVISRLSVCKAVPTVIPAHLTITNFGADNENKIYFYYRVQGTSDSGLAFNDTRTINSDSTDTVSVPIPLNIKDTGFYKVFVYIKLDSNQNTTNDTITFMEHVISAPKPSFSISLACVSKPVIFKNTTKADVSVNYEWYFGDGDSLMANDTSHIYNLDTSYTTILKSINSIGCTDTTSLKVKPLPISYSTFSFQPKGASYSFIPDDTSYHYYEWNFGDGDSSFQRNSSHTYKKNGIYPVTLYVKDANGCLDSLEELVDIIDAGFGNINTISSGIMVYPNPFGNYLEITIPEIKSGTVKINIYNSIGVQQVQITATSVSEGPYTYFLDPKKLHLVPGICYLEVIDGASVSATQVIYQK